MWPSVLGGGVKVSAEACVCGGGDGEGHADLGVAALPWLSFAIAKLESVCLSALRAFSQQ